MWFKIQNRIINLNSVSNFAFNNNTLQIEITFISGEKKTFSYSTWPKFNAAMSSINELVDKHMFEADENRKVLEEEQEIQEMLEVLQEICAVKDNNLANDILNGRGLKPLKQKALVPKDYRKISYD